ncbi:hypothetical protein CLV80_112114 [Yoonia maritima]|uniref:Uncharacterized protein n=1 Tax=Yoonia maritima TaxID=1435347 RepID=A0A2T0VVA2_9RHOB|nr:hypothetical protein [Yoonia maritima]PRY75527.1 hypothetical protein CLV80_112114 [Yoonia maritima]
MKEGKEIEISAKELEALADKLERFAKDLDDKEQTMLSAMVVLAGRELANLGPEGLRIDRGGDNSTGLQAGFAASFSRFAPGAFPEPSGNAAVLAPGTVCIE